MDNPRLTVSIVNYNAGDYLIGCLDSLNSVRAEIPMVICVVDNASSDDSIKRARERYPKINFVLNKSNLGFGKAHNQVLKAARTEYLLILNPDIVIKRGVLSELVRLMDADVNIGAATPKIIFEDGRVDLTAHRGFPTPLASLFYFFGNDRRYHLTERDMNRPHEVDAITGAFFLTKKAVLDRVGYFDEDYFMYAEDIDLCWRIKEVGMKVVYMPSKQIVHFKGISTGLKKHSQHLSGADLETKKRSLNYFYDTMKIFYRKHLEQRYPFFINWLVMLGINIQWWLAKRRLSV